MKCSKGKKGIVLGCMLLVVGLSACLSLIHILYAGMVMVMIPTLILYMCVQKKLTQGMTLGGLKG